MNMRQDLRELDSLFAIDLMTVQRLAENFAEQMTAGLAGRDSSLKMLSSFLDLPSGNEQGRFLALDFGGTNVRAAEIVLGGAGKVQIGKSAAAPLQDERSGVNLLAAGTTAAELFDYLALQVAKIAPPGPCLLGHTFSYPCRQTGKNTAYLIRWTKEICAQGVQGEDVNRLLAQALARRGLERVQPCAILNDTAGTLLTAAYQEQDADIAAICGTGHNACYRETEFTGREKGVINMESGNFDGVPGNGFDDLLDAGSDRPGEQRLEKMVGGRYLGQLTSLVLQQFVEYRPIVPVELSAADLSAVLNDTSDRLEGCGVLLQRSFPHLSPDLHSRQILRRAAVQVVKRAACLAAASFLGVLRHVDSLLARRHIIAVDGSLYEKMPGFANTVQAVMQQSLENSDRVSIRLVKDGSGIGAALAAAQAGQPEA